ncbi:hypothetical protein EBS40_05690 [bacterium]|nr:hypothetical protein [bacterium]
MEKFLETLEAVCLAYGKPYSEALAWVYMRCAKGDELRAVETLNALAFELGRLPSPAEIMNKMHPERSVNITDRQTASLVAQNIINAVGRLGANAKPDQIKAMIGEVGWEVVKNQWVNICSNMQASDEKIWFAQFRDQAEALLTRAKANKLNELPTFSKANEIINQLAESKKLGR